MEIKEIGTFEEELEICKNNPELKNRMDELFGKDMDCISIVGIGFVNGLPISIARLILPKPPDSKWRPKKIELNYGFDGKYEYFTLIGKDPDVGIVLASELSDEALDFVSVAKKTNMFLVEFIAPGEAHKIIVETDTGNVLTWKQLELSDLEYEKHLGGFYNENAPTKGSK